MEILSCTRMKMQVRRKRESDFPKSFSKPISMEKDFIFGQISSLKPRVLMEGFYL